MADLVFDKNLYVIYGAENYLKRQRADQIIESFVSKTDEMNFAKYNKEGVNAGEIIDLAETLPFFAEKRVIAVYGSEWFKKKAPDEIVEYLENIPESTVMVFVEDGVDKKLKTYKTADKVGVLLECTMPETDVLLKWMGGRAKKEGKNFTREGWMKFLNYTGSSMDNMDIEFKKLISYLGDRTVIDASDVEAICIPQVEDNVFNMINAMASNDLPRAMDMYKDLLTAREPAARILVNMGTQFRRMLMIADMMDKGMDEREMSRLLGEPDWRLRKNKQLCRNFSRSDLLKASEDCANFDYQIKNGLIADTVAVELLLVKYGTKK